ncbi:MAG TPA: TetR/AcrR family transcriptional regulator [Dyella sp.]|uniref:TetR/AcrR family transcriptional regulator n=1 Tax=Dyella sp. TaxID=1869338 RepID=UPI002BD39EE7|nr:TetR/AcrR family transcriptional regulator [Dyella sp.]HTV86978.1 TetR/AcrR family transcriptional regulator [Dyella sp.]
MPKALSDTETEAFRARICQAAAKLFVEEGPAAVTMRRLATELGCGTMTLYRYYDSKEAIITAIRTRGFDRLAQALENALDTPGDGRTRSRNVRDAYIDFARGDTATYRLMFEYPQTHRDDPSYSRAHARLWRCICADTRVMIEEGTIQADAPILGHQVWAALHGAVMLEIAGLLPEGFDAASLHTRTFVALMEAARPKPAS